MNHHPAHRVSLFLLALLLGAVFVATALADSGAGLLLRPWMEGQSVELQADALIQGASGTTDAVDAPFQLRWYEASGRYRVDPADRHSPAAGFDLIQIDLDTPHPMLPERLVDQSFGVGFGVGKFDNWEVGLTLGAGYAGDNPYGDGDAVYGLANLVAVNKIDDNHAWQLVLNYDGNRTIFPDIPLPGVAWYHRVSDELSYTAGVPFSSIHWQPLPQLTVDARYAVPFSLNVDAAYEVFEGFSIIGGFHNRFVAFHRDSFSDTKRLFFEQHRVEGGVRWVPCEWFDVTLVGGYAFGQEFNTGRDARDLDSLTEVSDAPYLRFGVGLRF